MGVLRAVVETDLPVFFEHQSDREAAAMAAFPSRDLDTFMAHWARTLASDTARTWTVVSDGAVAGNIGCWEDGDRRFVAYWIGRELWGRGLATQALTELLDLVDERPLHASVVASNVASARVLGKCGFVQVGAHVADDGVEELLFELPAPGQDNAGSVTCLVTLVDIANVTPSSLSFSVGHHALLTDGREIELLDGRGWTQALRHARFGDEAPRAHDRPPSQWDGLTREDIVEKARWAVGPDSADGVPQEEVDESHWSYLSDVLAEHGVEIDPASLAALPHTVRLSDRLLARLGEEAERAAEHRSRSATTGS